MFNIVENISAFSTGKQEQEVVFRNQNFLFLFYFPISKGFLCDKEIFKNKQIFILRDVTLKIHA